MADVTRRVNDLLPYIDATLKDADGAAAAGAARCSVAYKTARRKPRDIGQGEVD